ncbi:ADR071Wp [Eremothecium gossypii ATCC 10895]|uniref:Autophagy-related protein 9 n=1 Tax=Eremothecium gossypii (strain ATCC 10895 / CBS 109.51 / FGSC 9923 / NRRL Y-1056) TaxID=284811 RepID=ATG9_EREGS|nr:ADR071Wp [Eremothecium gossypii ATCC 10895]Q75A48.1 RecName: Full=Autophagy-related protein 9 [Eremothecium gossypii ATCC 10895]AAS51991.1 ADR071Wp [Eremothecium gossypii ATCC 10895]AEY96291.1 FADR071Wp [Eremothecium gossypii FDAG1]
MEQSEDTIQHERKNTFLSRVFGVHSSEVGDSIETAELSQYPIQIARSGSNAIDESRVIESDQASSSEEEDTDGHDLSVAENMTSYNGAQGSGSEDSDVPFSDQELETIETYTIAKVGQGSSSEDDRLQADSAEEEDALLFQHRLQDGSKGRNKVSSQPLGLKRILGSKGKSILGKEPASQEDSFIFRKGPTWDEENQLRPESKRPGLLSGKSNARLSSPSRPSPLSARERALWKWANVENLDGFLQDVYSYYLGNGFYCIMIEKILNLLTLLFIVFISTYMSHCIDYSKLPNGHKFSDVRVDQCYETQITGTTKLLFWIFGVFVVLKVVQMYFDFRRIHEIHNFYTYLLNISDKELQTIPWQSVIHQIMRLKDQNAVTANVVEVKAKNHIDAHDVANRIMRKENYLIALYNKDILHLSLPIPLYRTSTLTKTLEWNIHLCIIGFAFNEAGFLKQSFLNPAQREFLSEELKKRFILAGFLNIILAPFLVVYFVLLYFFRYFNEYKTSPGSLSTRQYTPIAEWKFREYNELYHLFKKRMGLSYEVANTYINQFPNALGDYFFKFVKFISGSFVAILALMTVLDPENFLNFELTADRTVLFYMTVLGTIWAVCHSAVNDNCSVFDPEDSLKELITYIHYAPKEWDGRYHTDEVKQEFCKLYNLRVILLLRELASLIMTPFILWFSLPNSAESIVDFFREVTVYGDGLGYVCKYAMFDENCKKGLRTNKHLQGTQTKYGHSLGDDHDSSDEETDKGMNKMIQSYMYFVDDYQNSVNAVGKYQIPKTQNLSHESKYNMKSHQHYSWKKQFKLGSKPEDFKIGSVTPRALSSSILANKPKSNLRARLDPEISHSNVQFDDLGESFINSIPVADYDPIERSDAMGGNGVLGLLNQYYRKSDVGR